MALSCISAGLPDEGPTAAAGDAFARPIGFGRAMNFRPGGNHQDPRVIDVFRDQSDNGRLDGGESTVITVSQEISRPKAHTRRSVLGNRKSGGAVCQQADGRECWGLICAAG